jgi:hypothetical protein
MDAKPIRVFPHEVKSPVRQRISGTPWTPSPTGHIDPATGEPAAPLVKSGLQIDNSAGIAKEAIERARVAADPSNLPSSPIVANSELYEGARAMAIVAGVIEKDQYPEELLYNHSTKQWHVKC